MAWYVESLILDRERIKQKALKGVSVIDYMDSSSPFNDLLLVEKAIAELYGKLGIDEIHIAVLQALSDGDSLVDMAKHKDIDVNMLIKHFFTACNKIAYELQGHFTDAGYVQYMSNKYDLDKQQVKKMLRYMQKSRRTRIRRLINDKATY